MRILVTGSKGQLGNEFQILANEYSEYSFTFTDIDELDILNKKAIDTLFEEKKFHCVINCAAYTNVDKAEEEYRLARRINVIGVKNIAKACNKYNAGLVHISTDYVYDGKNHRPYKETDFTNPQSAYGETKLEGEEMVEEFAKTAIIIRTSWLYSSFGHNFVKTMLKYGRERDELKVIYDQVGTPTYAANLAKIILNDIEDIQWIQGTHIYNYSDEGVCSWYDFAKEILELGNIDCKVYPIETKDYPLPATRPPYSILNKAKIKDGLTGFEIPHWKDALKVCISKMEINK